jgi:hypothetical protein
VLVAMPTLAEWAKLLHVGVGFWFVAGTVARNVAIRQAAASPEVAQVTNLMTLAGRFEKRMVIPGSAAVLVAGLLTTWAQHRPWFEHGSYWLITSLAAYVALFALVPLVFIPRGKIFEAALADAQARGRITSELTAAFGDRAVWAARTTELLVVAFIIALMVLKPF